MKLIRLNDVTQSQNFKHNFLLRLNEVTRNHVIFLPKFFHETNYGVISLMVKMC